MLMKEQGTIKVSVSSGSINDNPEDETHKKKTGSSNWKNNGYIIEVTAKEEYVQSAARRAKRDTYCTKFRRLTNQNVNHQNRLKNF